ncbi:WbqC family protein [Bacteroidales bacterium]
MKQIPLLLPTSYFPPIRWMAHYLQSQQIWIENWETYPKQTIRNRCYILTPAGVAHLTVPVVKTQGNHSLTCQIGIFYEDGWPRKHWRTLYSAYNKSPFFQYYRHHFEQFFETRFSTLIELNEAAIILILRLLKHNLKHQPSSHWQTDWPDISDMRFNFQPKPFGFEDFFPEYQQVFSDRQAFVSNLSVLDLIFNLGPEASQYLKNLNLRHSG